MNQTKDQLTLSKMLHSATECKPSLGKINGVCSFCGLETEHGHKFDSKTFTTFQFLMSGNVICEYCVKMLENSSIPYKGHFVCTENDFAPFKHDMAEDIFRNPPDKPFVMYFTQTWKKQGWTLLLNRVNYSQEFYVVGCDYDLINVNSEERENCFADIRYLQNAGLKKSEMTSGVINGKLMEKLDDLKHILHMLEVRRKDPLWELCVYVAKKGG